MQHRSLVRALALMLSLGSTLGCAVASGDVDGIVRGDAGKKVDTSTLEEDDASSEVDSGSTGVDSSSPPVDSGSPSTDTGSSAPDTSPVDTGPSGTACTTLGSAECSSSYTDLGSLSGDKGSGVKTGSGSDSQWFHVFVSEDDSSLLTSVDLRARITLSPTKGNFDLYVYRGKAVADGGAIECSTVSNSSTNPTGADTIAMKWADNRPIGGSDDGRTLSIEVRATDAMCTDASWTLTVEGNK